MSQIATSTWSEVAASNNATPPGGWPEGQAPSTVNDCAREMMSAVKIDFNQRNPTVTSGGSANVQTLTYTTAPAAYVQGLSFSFIAGFTNTGTATLNVNALAAKNIFADNKALAGGEIQAGMVVEVKYDGTQFQIVSRAPVVNAPYGFKNVIINGDFQVQQRGLGGAINIALTASTPQYAHDRVYFTNGANQASTAFVTAGSGIAGQSRFAGVFQRNNAQTGTGVMTVEFPLTTDQLSALRGRIATLQFKVAVGATFLTNNSAGLTCTFYMGVGTEGRRGGGFSTETSTCATTTASLTGAFQLITATSAAIIPATTTQGSVVFSWTPTATAGATDQVILAEVQLEPGGVATSFDRRPFDVELARCQRFYWKSFPYATAPAQNATTAGALRIIQVVGAATGMGGNGFILPTRMRVAGSGTLYNPSAANAQIRNATVSADCTSSSIAPDENNFVINATSAAGSSAGNANIVHAAIDSDL